MVIVVDEGIGRMKIDYLSATAHMAAGQSPMSLVKTVLTRMGFDGRSVHHRVTRGYNGYQYSIPLGLGGHIQWSNTDLRMGVHVSLSGTSPLLQDMDAARRVHSIMCDESEKTSASRVDVAFDTAVSLRAACNAVYERHKHARPALVRYESGDGYTLYCGAASSDKRVRVYDKGVEQGVQQEWWRFEYQYRAKVAASVWSSGFAQIYPSQRMAPVWDEGHFERYTPAEFPRPVAKHGGAEWVWSAVAPALVRLARDGEVDVEALFTWVKKELDATRHL